MKNKKSFTLIELIIALSLMGLVILLINAISLTFSNRINIDVSESNLNHNTHLALETVLREVKKVNYLEPSANSLKLTKKQGASTNTSEYYLDTTSKELRYRANITQPTQYAVIQKNVQTFNLTGVNSLGTNRYQAVRIKLEAKDSQNRTDYVSMLQSLAFCRILYTYPVRVVDASRTNVKGLYSSILEAVSDPSTSDTDIIQVSSNNKQPYYENRKVTLSKSLTLEGAYNKKDWSRHPGDPNYETIIDGQQHTRDIIECGAASLTIKVDNFTIQNGDAGFAFTLYAGNSFTITNNTITGNNEGISVVASGVGSSVTITNNTITNNGRGIRATSGSSGSITITNNDIEGNSSYSGIYAWCESAGKLYITNNNITGNTTYLNGGGIYARCVDGGSSLIEVTNNIITGNYSHGSLGGGGICVSTSGSTGQTVAITNNTLTGNTTDTQGGGIYVDGPSSTITTYITNTICYGNSPDNIYQKNSGSIIVTDGYSGGDPKFVGGSPYSYILQAIADGYPANSPCIDKGNNNSSYYDPYDRVLYPPPNPPPSSASALPPAKGKVRNDIGAYGGPGAGTVGATP